MLSKKKIAKSVKTVSDSVFEFCNALGAHYFFACAPTQTHLLIAFFLGALSFY